MRSRPHGQGRQLESAAPIPWPNVDTLSELADGLVQTKIKCQNRATMPAATIATPISDVPLHDWTPAADHLSVFNCHPILCLEPVISAKPKRCLDKITTTPRDLLLIRLCLLYQTTRFGTMCDIGRIIITPLASITGKEVSHGNFSVTDGNAFFFCPVT
jgi:hypothetical protein